MATSCYDRDVIYNHNIHINPLANVNFAEMMYQNLLHINDSIQCVNRYIWKNLPIAMTSQEIERLLYENGSICAFLHDGILNFARYTTMGKINSNGKLNKIQPIGLNGKNFGEKRRVYNMLGEYEYTEDCAVIIYDYTGPSMGDNIQPRSYVNEFTTIHDECKTYKIMLHSIVLSIKKLVARCNNEEQARVISKQAEALLDPTSLIVPVAIKDLSVKFELMQFAADINVDELVRAIEFYSKKRRAFNGIPSPDTFEKKERMITPEVDKVLTHSNLVLYDGLQNRKLAADRINKCFGYNIDVDYSPAISDSMTVTGPYQDHEQEEGNDNDGNQ